MAIFLFCKDGGRPPSWICYARVQTTSEGNLVVFGAKLGWNRCSRFDNMHVFRFREFGFKTAIHALKFGFWGDLTPINGDP